MYDLERLFDDYDIEYWAKGKNVSKGWVNIQCPFCNDKSNHLGVNINTGAYSCWKCSTTGELFFLISELLSIEEYKSKKLIKKYREDFIEVKKEKKVNTNTEIILPKEATNILSEKHRQYLISRGFDPDYIQKKYRIMACDILGDYKFRIVIPIFFKGKLVNFAAKAIDDSANLKIKNCPNEKVVIQRDSLLYNIDNIKNRKAIIVEGFTDVWKMGDCAVATMGTKFTNAQIQLLSVYCSEAYILYDSKEKDAQAPIQAEKLAHSLYSLIKKVEILELPHGDPGDLTYSEVENIKKEIGII
jgi:DNA primase